jgi:hypothetical protein
MPRKLREIQSVNMVSDSVARRKKLTDKLHGLLVSHLDLIDQAEFMLSFWLDHGAPPVEDVYGLLNRLGDASAENQIQFEPLADKDNHVLDCPQCKKALLFIGARAAHTEGENRCLSDDDDSRALYRSLVAAGLERPRLDLDERTAVLPSHHYHAVEASRCPSCGHESFVLRAGFLDDRVYLGAESDFLKPIALGAVEYPAATYHRGFFYAEPDIKSWLILERVTPVGVAIEHVFGPFLPSEKDDVQAINVGELNAKAWSHDLLLEHWTSFKGFARKINRERHAEKASLCATPLPE